MFCILFIERYAATLSFALICILLYKDKMS